jgi:hypothetical protein
MLKKIYLTGYRLIGLTALMLITSALMFYTMTFGFFLFNTTWVAPTVLSPSDPKVIQARAELIRQSQFYDTATILRQTRMQELKVLEARESQLNFLKKSIDSAINFEVQAATRSVGALDSLIKQKNINIADIGASLTKLDELILSNDRELSARLITKDQWTARTISYSQLRATITSNQSEALALVEQRDMLSRSAATLGGRGTSAMALDTVAKKLSIQNELNGVWVQMITKQSEVLAADQELARLAMAEAILDETPYAPVLKTGRLSVLGFMPYDNSYFKVENVDVYACRAIFLLCYKVGTVEKIYDDEQIIEFPIFNTRFTRTVKGVFVEFDLTDTDASREQILFLGRKPFFI